jgi:magnesium chelatase subunit D
MVLITDGLPSYASGNTDDPLIDAMTAAREIKALNFKFTCIGLESQQNYLIELAKIAGGTVYNRDNIVS